MTDDIIAGNKELRGEEKMKSARLTAPGHIEIADIQKPKVENGHEVLVKVKAVGICGTDLHTFKGERDDVVYPRVMGHELSGMVEAVGAAVTRVKPGNHVIYDPVNSCGHCRTCKSGHENVCSDVRCFGVQMDGGLQEYIVVEETHLYPVSNGIPFAVAALGEPFSIAANVLTKAQIRSDDGVVLFGAGTIGIAILQAAKQYGAKILVTDVSDEKLKIAEEFGADSTVNNTKEDLNAAVRQFFGHGADVVIDAVGFASLLEEAVPLTEPCARIVELGFDSKPAFITPAELTKKELTVYGSRMNCHCFETVSGWMKKGIITGKMISQTYPLEKLQQAFEDTIKNGGQWLKTMIEIN